MNATGEENRNGRRGNDPRGVNQQRQPAGPRDGNLSASQIRRGGKTGANITKPSETAQNGSAATTTLPPPDDHVPMAGFNSDAVAAMLKQGFEAKAPVYKPEAKTQTKAESAWGAKAGAMANGKDFWLELRKQVAALQQSGGVSQGG